MHVCLCMCVRVCVVVCVYDADRQMKHNTKGQLTDDCSDGGGLTHNTNTHQYITSIRGISHPCLVIITTSVCVGLAKRCLCASHQTSGLTVLLHQGAAAASPGCQRGSGREASEGAASPGESVSTK